MAGASTSTRPLRARQPMTFVIKTMLEAARGLELISPVWGEITLGDFVESFPLITSLWSVSDYEDQWKQAIGALIDGRVHRAMLVTDIQPTSQSDAIMYFALFRDGEDVFVRHRF